ncbi:hypothetical protein GCM10010442_76570 [Kitasatospora kifunensis]
MPVAQRNEPADRSLPFSEIMYPAEAATASGWARAMARPTTLTDEGRRRLNAAQGVVYAIEARMIQAIPDERLTELLEDLDRIVRALTD